MLETVPPADDDEPWTAPNPPKTRYEINNNMCAHVVPGGMVLVIDHDAYFENDDGEHHAPAVTSEFLPGATVEQFEAIYGVKS